MKRRPTKKTSQKTSTTPWGSKPAYLATGQARRAEAIRQAMANWRQFRPIPYDASKGIQLGALVCLVDSDDKQQQLFLGPDGGSMKLVSGAQRVQVISSEAPLGRALLGKCEGDEVSIQVAPIRQRSGSRCCGFIEPPASSRRVDERRLASATPSTEQALPNDAESVPLSASRTSVRFGGTDHKACWFPQYQWRQRPADAPAAPSCLQAGRVSSTWKPGRGPRRCGRTTRRSWRRGERQLLPLANWCCRSVAALRP